jgi:hypothetical protein
MKEVLVIMGIGRGGGERISATAWMGHEVLRGGDGKRLFSGPGGRRSDERNVLEIM